jgi:lysophospholipase L1-like esterase
VVPVDVGRVTAVGDSVMAGAGPAVYEKFSAKAHVDAMVNRQVGTGVQILTSWRDAGLLGDVVLVHLGNNGTFTDAQLDQMMQVLAGVPKVALVTNKVPRSWEGPNNAVIVSAPSRFPNVVLVDWKGHSDPHPEWFYDDGIHLRPDGARAYAEFIASVVAPAPAPAPA